MSAAPGSTGPAIRLSDLVGSRVRDPHGAGAGRVVDLLVTLDDVFPAVCAVLVRPARRAPALAVPIARFTALAPGTAVLDGPLGAGEPGTGLQLARDVLDVQVIDTAGRRLARVAEVDLAWDQDVLRVIAVDVGWRAILHRLGLRRLARRASRDAIDWAGVHLASGPGHPLQLASAGAAVHRLDAGDLAELLARLPAARAGEVLDAVAAARAAGALGAVHPELAADLVEVLPPDRALVLLGELTQAEAADALREAGEQRRDELLGAMDAERAAQLRAAIARPRSPVHGEPRPPRRYWRILRGHEGGRR